VAGKSGASARPETLPSLLSPAGPAPLARAGSVREIRPHSNPDDIVRTLLVVLTLALAAAGAARPQSSAQAGDWGAYGHDAGGTRFSPLGQIDTSNVSRLGLAWVYRTGDLLRSRGRFEATPLVLDGLLYLSTPLGRVSALDPATGAERWTYDPRVDLARDYGDFANRGVSAWRDPGAAAGAPCTRRIYVATVDARLIALDGTTGTPCAGFGSGGTVDLGRDLLNPPAFPGEYEVTSPPAVVGGLVIVGSSIGDNNRTDAPSGVVRAYDARTGAERWRWDPIPRRPGDPGYQTWRGATAHRAGAANAWSVMSADTALGLVFVPVGSASPDFYGGERLGQNLYANSVVALQASSGRVAWSFQVVHHDLWDYDVPAQPVAFDLRRNGQPVPALAVATKMGHLFILDRRSGRPLVPVRELPVPRAHATGEAAWPTQPFPPEAYRFVAESLSASQAFGLTPAGRAACASRIASLDYRGIFTPSSLRGAIHYPGHLGGFNWSGVSVDEAAGLLVAPVNQLGMVVTLVPRDSLHAVRMAHPGAEVNTQRGTPFGMMREVLLGPDRAPCTPPPWGELVGFDLARGRTRWRVPLGNLKGLEGRGWGSLNLGGVLLTRGGLAFVAGTLDRHLRAFDLATGRELWSAPLPVGGHALPMTYMAGGREYVAIAAGGHDRLTLGPPALGDYLLVYALDAPGVPVTDTVSHPLTGRWDGELRVEDHERFPLTFELAGAADSLTGQVRADSGGISGPLVLRRDGGRLTLRLTFEYPAKHCGGEISGAGDQASGGTLLVGTLEVRTTCSDHPEPGTFSFRRAKQ
jgi:quinoprotein glucose dehydrogenase